MSTAGIDDMIGRYDRRTRWWYRAFKPPLPLISNPSEAMLPAGIAGRRLLVGGAGAGRGATWTTPESSAARACRRRPRLPQ